MKKSSYMPPVPERQADATLNQANPGDGTQYEVLPTTRNARIIGITVICTWTVQPTPLEIHVTIDGQTLTFAKTDPVSGTYYTIELNPERAENAGYLTGWAAGYYILMEGRSIRITAEITGGTVSNLSARVKYARW